MPSNLPSTVTSTTLADQLKDKIRLELVNLIPEEEFQKMIKQVADRFFDTQYDRYAGKEKCSEFTLTVLTCLREDVRNRISSDPNSGYNNLENNDDFEEEDPPDEDDLIQPKGTRL